MILICAFPDGDSGQPPKNNIVITDALGLGKAVESIADGLGKALGKLSSNKISPGLTFVVLIVALTFIFLTYLAALNTPNTKMIIIWMMIFVPILTLPFVYYDLKEKHKNNKK